MTFEASGGRGLTPERFARLDKIGFVWDRDEARWEENFKKLLRYKENYRDCNVPTRWIDDPQFAKWVGKQRSDNRLGKLLLERFAGLDEIGFVWDPYETQ